MNYITIKKTVSLDGRSVTREIRIDFKDADDLGKNVMEKAWAALNVAPRTEDTRTAKQKAANP